MKNLELIKIAVVEQTDVRPPFWQGLAAGVKEMFRVDFEAGLQDVSAPCLMFGQSEIPRERSVLQVPGGAMRDSTAAPTTVSVRFSDQMEWPFHGHSFKTQVNHRPEPLELNAEEEVLAFVDEQPVWTRRKVGATRQYRTSLRLPAVAAEKIWSDGFHGGRFLELLPLVAWLRELTGETGIERPQIRACFIIDDPNLHSCKYGFVDYAAIAKHAREHHYHVSFATIPLDGWFTSRAAVEIFRSYPNQLSLMIHGNNHTYKELWQNYSDEVRVGLIQQAVARISKLEARTQVKISRMIAPPHGACSDVMLEALPANGINGATISHGSLRSFNSGKSWTYTVGYKPGEWIRGCPVLPRWGINSDFRPTALLAAYLGQPLIFMGHHQDLSAGLDWFGAAAKFINTFPNVCWSNIETLFSKSVQTFVVADILHVRPWSARVTVSVPTTVRRLQIDLAAGGGDGSWHVYYSGNSFHQVGPNQIIDLAGADVRVLELVRVNSAHHSERGTPPPAFWPFMRRLLTEGRDRWSGRYKQ